MKGPDKMNKHTPIKPPASLLERANELYDFGAALRGGAPVPAPIVEEQMVETAPAQPVAPAAAPAPVALSPNPAPRSPTRGIKPLAKVDRERLLSLNFIDPYGSVTGLSEEFRIVKRQLLLAARGGSRLR